MNYYSLVPIIKLEPDALYYMGFGERSNGKTFSVKSLALFGIHEKGVDWNGYLDDGSQLAIIRRYKEDFKGKNGRQFYDDVIHNKKYGNMLEKATKGEWNDILFWSQCWYLIHRGEDGKIDKQDLRPLAYSFSIADHEHVKSTAYPDIKYILFDEFITRGIYLADEVTNFFDVVSTIVRDEDKVRIFMMGNTVNKYNPYFSEMGLTNASTMKQGTIDVYKYYNEKLHKDLKVAVEFTGYKNQKERPAKKSDIYFGFNNPRLKMITDGVWEISQYPHCPCRYDQKEVLMRYYISFSNNLLEAEIVNHKDMLFTFIHAKTSPIREDNENIVYSQEYNASPHYRRLITRITAPVDKFIISFFSKSKVFYSTNEVGDVVTNYIKWCKTQSV